MDPIVIKVPKEIDKMNPINFYLYTNKGLQPLSRNIFSSKNVLYGAQKEMIDEQNIGKLIKFEDSFEGRSNRRKSVERDLRRTYFE